MTSYESLLTQAKASLKSKNHADAEHQLLSAIKINREGTEALYLLANHYHHRGKFDRAIVAYKKALSIKPNYTEAALSLSILYNDLGHYEEGRLMFNRIQKQVPSKTTIHDSFLDEKLSAKHSELGDLYESYSRHAEAEVEYQKALKLTPDDPQTIVKIAKLHEKQGAHEQSIKGLKALTLSKPDYIPALIKLGLTYYSQGKMIEALREWERVLDIDPKHHEALMYLEMAQRATTTTL